MSLIIQVTKKFNVFFQQKKKSDKSSAVEFSSTNFAPFLIEIAFLRSKVLYFHFFSTLKMRSNLIPFIFFYENLFSVSFPNVKPCRKSAMNNKLKFQISCFYDDKKTGTDSVMF
jgi:hypothetical protein